LALFGQDVAPRIIGAELELEGLKYLLDYAESARARATSKRAKP
jgi:hypothetical protein